MIVVWSLSMVTFFAVPRSSRVTLSTLMPRSWVIDAAAGGNGNVFEHRLTPVSVAGSFHRGDAQDSAKLVHDERGERFVLHILGDDQQ